MLERLVLLVLTLLLVPPYFADSKTFSNFIALLVWFDSLHHIQQLWSCRDGQFT